MKREARKQFNYKQVMQALKDAGTAQNVKTFRNHGVTGELFGVSYAFFKTLEKQVAHDLELAEALWKSGNHDARVFACWIADADRVTLKLLESWAGEVDNHVIATEVAGLAAFTDFGAKLSRKWRKTKNEFRAAMGWSIVATLAMQPSRTVAEGGMTDEELLECLDVIEAQIHDAANRTKYSMNAALIAIGCRENTSKSALAVAKRVGPVEVDHGNTSCTTIVAYDRIRETLARYAAQGKKPTDGSGGKRRRHC